MTYPKSITLSVAKSPAANGAELLAKYAQAKTLTPNGSALSATNRVTIWIPPGTFLLPSTLALDTSYIDLRAMDPIETGWNGPQTVPTFPSGFSTLITCAGGGKPTILQTANDTRLYGFAVENTGTTTGTLMSNSDCGLVVKTSTNGATNNSIYRRLYFQQTPSHASGAIPAGRMGVCPETGYSLAGVWIECVTRFYGWRLSHTSPKSTSPLLMGRFYQCYGGERGFGGDIFGDGTYEPGITGYFYECAAKQEGFGGCSAAGTYTKSTAEFWYCRADVDSFSKGAMFDGKAYYCKAGAKSFGAAASASGEYLGQIGPNAVLVGCEVDGDGFAASGRFNKYRSTQAGWTHGIGGVRGKLIDCRAESLANPIRLCGGKIQGGSFKTVTTNGHAINLRSTGGQITGAKIVSNGTGKSVTTKNTDWFAGTGGANTVAGNRYYSGDAIHTLTYPVPVKESTVTINYTVGAVAKTVTDDGAGNLTGDVDAGGTNTINYATGAVDVTFTGVPDTGWNISTSYEIDLGSAGQPAIAGCVMNGGLDLNVGNLVATPNNVADSDIV